MVRDWSHIHLLFCGRKRAWWVNPLLRSEVRRQKAADSLDDLDWGNISDGLWWRTRVCELSLTDSEATTEVASRHLKILGRATLVGGWNSNVSVVFRELIPQEAALAALGPGCCRTWPPGPGCLAQEPWTLIRWRLSDIPRSAGWMLKG